MKNKKKLRMKKIICLILAISMIIPTFLSMVVNASEKIIEVKDVEGEQCVLVSELMNQMNYIVSKKDEENYGAGLNIIVDDNVLDIYEDCQQYYLNGEMVAISTEEVKDNSTGESYQFPVSKLPSKSEYDYDFYVSTEFLNKYLGIDLPGEKGYSFDIPDETTDETSENENSEESQVEETTEKVYTVVPDETSSGITVID